MLHLQVMIINTIDIITTKVFVSSGISAIINITVKHVKQVFEEIKNVVLGIQRYAEMETNVNF